MTKKKSKGFTLIELLAVIVILAIIALIATPIVLNLIEKARKGAAQDSAYGLRKAAQLYYTSSLLENVSVVDITFNCDKVNGCVSEDNKVKLDIDGTIPSNGKIEVKSDGEITYSNIVINGYTCEMENKGEITCTKGGEEAPSVDKTAPTITLGEIITTENSITIPYTVDDTEATVTCEYGTDTNYGSVGTIENGTCVINGLTAGTEYFYKITVTDSSSNSSIKEGSNIPKDLVAPVLTLGTVTPKMTTITVSYTVDDTETTVTCEYGTDTNYGSVGTISNGLCTMSGLDYETTYFYKIIATDQSNNVSEPLTGNSTTKPYVNCSSIASTCSTGTCPSSCSTSCNESWNNSGMAEASEYCSNACTGASSECYGSCMTGESDEYHESCESGCMSGCVPSCMKDAGC